MGRTAMSLASALIAILAMAVAAGTWLYLYLRYGREHVAAPVSGPVAEPPDEWSPVQLGLLWNYGQLQLSDMVASMLDLVRRGVLRLIAEPVSVLEVGGIAGVTQHYDFFIERVPGGDDRLTEAERYLMDEILFRYGSGEGPVSLFDTMVEGARNFQAACGRFDTWRRIAEREPTPFAFEDPLSLRMSRVCVTAGLATLAAGSAIALLWPSILVLPLLLLGTFMIPGSKTVHRRTRDAVAALARWQAFRRHLDEWSAVRDGPAHSVVLLEQYLVYGVSLGVARTVIRAFQMLLPTRGTISAHMSMYRPAFALEVDAFSQALVAVAGGPRGPGSGGTGET
jgi:hypothetical protein